MTGLCECGCGGTPRISPHTNTAKGWVKGEPRRFIRGHHLRVQLGVLVCADCGNETPRRGQGQRYCPSCSGERDDARKKVWAAKNPAVATPGKHKRQQSQIVEAGAARSLEARRSVTWDAFEPIPSHTLVRVAVPFDYAASKNATWRHGRGGHVYARAESTAMRDHLAAQIRNTRTKWFQGKVWIDIFVEKPNHRGDAVNVVDLVCDAVKDAIGVDDRWYSITRLDWAIVKTAPRLLVGIRQEVGEDHQICSHCGRSLPVNAENFGRNKSMATGFARVCCDCAAPVRGRRAA